MALRDTPLRRSQPAPGVTLLTLTLPRLRNAMTAELTTAWQLAFDDLRADPSLRAIVVTGEGPVFCSGADLSWLDQGGPEMTPDRLRERMLPFYRTWLAPREISVPVIAAINGPAIGAGLALALACDLRYAAPTATFRTPFIQIGTHGGMAANWLLAGAVGESRAREMLYTGREIGADEALLWGLVNSIADDAVAAAVRVAEQIASAAPIATKLTKSGVNQLPMSFEAALQWDALAQPLTMATVDLHEGIEATRERRSPLFEGH